MSKVEIEMPQMGESVMEGTVIEWAKNVGDRVEEDETLLEIATDKVDTEVPSPQAGTLIEQKAQADDTIEVGQVIAIIETNGEAGGEAASSEEDEKTGDQAGEEESAKEPAQAEEKEQQKEEESSGDEGERVEVPMPQMGESVMEGTVIEWAKEIGDKVEEDETLLEIATDKVDTEVPSPQAGTLVEKLVEADETIEVGETIAIIATGKPASESSQKETDDDEQQSEQKAGSKQDTQKTTAAKSSSTARQASSNGSKPQRIGSNGRFYSPLVRSIAAEEGISQEELENIDGSGRDGRVAKQDIINYLEQRETKQKQAPAKSTADSQPSAGGEKQTAGKRSISAGELDIKRPAENVEIVKMDRMRKMIAEHMINSKHTSAHVTTFAEVDVTKLVLWREANKQAFKERSGYKLTFTPLFIEQIIQAIREFPLINSSIDLEKSEIHLKKDINFGLAVALGQGGKGGLIVPVIKKAQEKNLVGLAGEVNDLAVKARNKDLSPDDLVGGTVTLTNYGSVGNLMGTPIINQPQVAIIGTGAIEKRPVVREMEQGDVIAIRHMMYLSMSYDHRIIDGAHGGAFLNRVKKLLQDFDPEREV